MTTNQTQIRVARVARMAPLLGAVLLSSAWLLEARPAAAVAAPMASVYVNSPIPAGGVITGTVQCTFSCSASPPTFSGSDGAAIAGTFVEGNSGVGFVFVPTTPLAPGTYTAFVSGGITPASTSFTVVEATSELPTFVSSVTTMGVPAGDPITCQEQDSQSVGASFTEQTLVKPVVVVGLSGLYATQYRYGLTLEGEAPVPLSATPVQRIFDDVESGEICFDISGFSYQDDSVTPIGRECVSLEGLSLGLIDQETGSRQQTLVGCVVPPAGYESEWCAVFESAFTSGSCDGFTLDACFSARTACPTGDNPSEAEEQEEREARAAPPTGGVSGTGGGATGGVTAGSGGTAQGGSGQGASVSTGGGTPGTGGSGTGAGETPSGEVRACSLVRAPSSGGLAWLLVSLSVAFGVRRRRVG